jgi:hypothetical protein
MVGQFVLFIMKLNISLKTGMFKTGSGVQEGAHALAPSLEFLLLSRGYEDVSCS